jgi:hypothetical protein
MRAAGRTAAATKGQLLGRTAASRTSAAKAAFEDIPMVTDCTHNKLFLVG